MQILMQRTIVIAHDSGGTNLYGGTWVINNGNFTETLTNVSGPSPHGRVGDTAPPQKIISVDAHHMTIEVGGRTHTMTVEMVRRRIGSARRFH